MFAIDFSGGILPAIGALLTAVGGYFGWKKLRQERANAPDMVANVDAARDTKEADSITNAIDKSDKAGKVSDEERKLYGEI